MDDETHELYSHGLMPPQRVLFAYGAWLAARTYILIKTPVASFRTICPKSKVSIRYSYSTSEPAQPANHLPVTVDRTLFVSRGHLRIYCVLLILALFGSRVFFVVPWLLWSRGPVVPVVLLWRRGSHRCRGPVVSWCGPNDSHLHLRPPRTQAHSHRVPARCVKITDTRKYCSDVQRL